MIIYINDRSYRYKNITEQIYKLGCRSLSKLQVSTSAHVKHISYNCN